MLTHLFVVWFSSYNQMFMMCNILFVVYYYFFVVFSCFVRRNNYLFVWLNYLFPGFKIN